MVNLEAVKGLIEFEIFNSSTGDYISQALILKDMNPKGW